MNLDHLVESITVGTLAGTGIALIGNQLWNSWRPYTQRRKGIATLEVATLMLDGDDKHISKLVESTMEYVIKGQDVGGKYEKAADKFMEIARKRYVSSRKGKTVELGYDG